MTISKKQALKICESLHIFFGRNNDAAKKLLMFVKSVEESTDTKIKVDARVMAEFVELLDDSDNGCNTCALGTSESEHMCYNCGYSDGVDNYEKHPAFKVYKKYLNGKKVSEE